MHFQTSTVYKALVHACNGKKLVQSIKVMKKRTKCSLSLQIDSNKFIWLFSHSYQLFFFRERKCSESIMTSIKLSHVVHLRKLRR